MTDSFDYISLRYKDFIEHSLNYLILKAMEYLGKNTEFEKFIMDRGKVFFIDSEGNEYFKFYIWVDYTEGTINKFPDFFELLKRWGDFLMLEDHYICVTQSDIVQFELWV